MFEKLRKRLKDEGRSFVWWVGKYLPDKKYYTVMSQINGIATTQDYLSEAVKKYLEE